MSVPHREVSDLSSEFQREREEMLDTIRQLARQIKLKDLILEGFAPSAKVKALEERAECCVEINQCVGCTDNSSLSHFSVMTRPSWLGRAARKRHRHAIEQASRRWRG